MNRLSKIYSKKDINYLLKSLDEESNQIVNQLLGDLDKAHNVLQLLKITYKYEVYFRIKNNIKIAIQDLSKIKTK